MRMIDTSEATTIIADYFDAICDTEYTFDEAVLLKLLNNKAVEAVPVTRCKDCKHHYYHEMLKQDYCEITNIQFGEIEPNGYCHRAERKDA